MAFGTISNTIPSAVTFNQAGTGKYIWSSSVFGGPSNYYQISPVRKIKPIGNSSVAYTFGVSRYCELDLTVNGVVVRRAARVRTVIDIDDGFTLANVDEMLRQIDEFMTSTTMNRILNGEV